MPVTSSRPLHEVTPESLRQEVSEAMVETATRLFPRRLRVIVLTGSMARDEATFTIEGKEVEVWGDAEFVLVFHDGARLPSADEVEFLRGKAQAACKASSIRCQVDCSVAHGKYFRKLPRTIYAYELLQNGRVVWGDGSVLQDAPRFPALAIAREDAWRMVCNRLIETLEAAHSPSPEGGREVLPYRLAKLQMDIATSLLVFEGLYQPSYAARAAALRSVDPKLGEAIGISWHAFVAATEAATRQKLGMGTLAAVGPQQVRDVLAVAMKICAWELRQLLGITVATGSAASLMRLWMRRQSELARLRGWAYLWRAQGRTDVWRHWPLWIELYRHGSPRYWIYLAALEAARLEIAGKERAWNPRLPLKGQAPVRSAADAVREIARNYRACAVGTTS
jgi:hypothetical protein